jgi:predicted  nucleic acid-binding Zn-ribbon protein
MEEINKELENQILELGNLLNQKDRDMLELKEIIKELHEENKELKKQNNRFFTVCKEFRILQKQVNGLIMDMEKIQ